MFDESGGEDRASRRMAWRAPFALVEVDRHGLITASNQLFAAWAATSPGQTVGISVAEALGVDPSEYARAVRIADHSSPTTLVRQRGAGPSHLTMARTRLSDGGEVIGFAASEDPRASAEGLAVDAAFQLERARLGTLLRAAVSFSNATSDEQLSALLVEVLKSVFGSEHASVHLRSDQGFTRTGGHNPLLAHWPAAMPPPGSHTMNAGQVQSIPSPEKADDLLPGAGMGATMLAAGVGAVLVAPIIDQGTPFGAVGCYFAEPRSFDDDAKQLIISVAQQSAGVFSRLRVERDLRRVAMLDEVTGLPNRRLFETQLERGGTWGSRSIALVFIDLDGFKQVNDRLGHPAGDHLLSEVAERLRRIQRAEDAICRFGGDEFLVSFEADDHDAAQAVAERIRVALSEPYPSLPDGLRITASVGYALAHPSDAPLSVDRLIREADSAMYEAKSVGGDTVVAR